MGLLLEIDEVGVVGSNGYLDVALVDAVIPEFVVLDLAELFYNLLRLLIQVHLQPVDAFLLRMPVDIHPLVLVSVDGEKIGEIIQMR